MNKGINKDQSKNSYNKLENLIMVANKKRKADIIIKNASIINVFNESIEISDIAIYEDKIAGIGHYDNADIVIDANYQYVSPSFIDSHMHIESTKLLPLELAKALIPLGTLAIIADPHEIANVCGIKGIEFLIKSSDNLPLDIYFMASSCVPATKFETNYKELDFKKLKNLKKYNRIIGLAEVMNYPSVINHEKQTLLKILSFNNLLIDGHCPSLSKEELNAYISAGIYSDHECTSKEEAMEKLSKGMYIMIREGSVTKDLLNLLSIINDKTKSRILLCTDDKDPDDIIYKGHINYSISLLVENGIPLPLAIKLATINPSLFFNFKHRGGIAPGYFADLLIFKDLKNISHVIKNGKIIYENGSFNNNVLDKQKNTITKNHTKEILNTIHINKISDNLLSIKEKNKKIRVISIRKDSVITDQLIVEPKIEKGFIKSDIDRDIIKIAVFERHHWSGKFSIGFIKGLKIKKGAFASSIAHDSHNIVVVGENDYDMINALSEIKKLRGGIAISCENKIVDSISLPHAGLMSNLPVKELAEKFNSIRNAAKTVNLIEVEDPFMIISFMTLAVIPHLKITDMGLFDTDIFDFVDLFID